MESFFEEKLEFSPIFQGWKQSNEDQEQLQQLITQVSLLEDNKFESEGWLINAQEEDQLVYIKIINEVLQILQDEQQEDNFKWVSLKYRRVCPVKNKKGKGFKLFGGGEEFTILFESELLYLNFQRFIIEYCIQLNFDKQYKIEKTIGKGSFAQVFEGTELETGETVAIKQISKEQLKSRLDYIKPLVKEIDSMRSLRHPNICCLFSVFEDPDFVYLIIEYCGEGSLFKRIVKREKFTEQNAAKFAMNFLSALIYLHDVAFVVHRDLKPENILMTSNTSDYEFQIVDFGLATKFNPLKLELNQKCGSPGYVAPEILKGEQYGPKVDIFSLGIIIYILLVGKQPFYGKNPQEVIIQNKLCNINFKAKHWKFISKDALDFVVQLTDPNPIARPTAQQALQHKWFRNLTASNQILTPANEIKTPVKLNLNGLSPGVTPSCKLISREKIHNMLVFPLTLTEESQEEVNWTKAVNSPCPSVTFSCSSRQTISSEESDQSSDSPLNKSSNSLFISPHQRDSKRRTSGNIQGIDFMLISSQKPKAMTQPWRNNEQNETKLRHQFKTRLLGELQLVITAPQTESYQANELDVQLENDNSFLSPNAKIHSNKNKKNTVSPKSIPYQTFTEKSAKVKEFKQAHNLKLFLKQEHQT